MTTYFIEVYTSSNGKQSQCPALPTEAKLKALRQTRESKWMQTTHVWNIKPKVKHVYSDVLKYFANNDQEGIDLPF